MMIKTLAVFGFALLFIAGCESPSPQKPSLKGIALADLAPARLSEPQAQFASVDFTIYCLSIPAASASVLNDIFSSNKDLEVNKSDSQFFSAANFAALTGSGDKWDAFAQLLNNAGGKSGKTIQVFVPEDKQHFLDLTIIAEEQSIFVPSEYGTNGLTLGPSKAGLIMQTSFYSDPKGMCTVSFTPAIQPLLKTYSITGTPNSADIQFPQFTFSATFAPGSFLFFAPQYTPQPLSLAECYFAENNDILLYLIVCDRVSD